MTANASSLSVSSRPELRVDLAAARLLAPLPSAWLAGRDLDLLEPLRFLPPGKLPAVDRPPAPAPAPAVIDRRELAEALAVANRAYGNENADRLARKLADPATRVVVTGQQPGLLGGPLYCLAKAVAVARWAAALEAAGEPAVAVYWVATEDHDWAEVSSTVVIGSEGAREFSLGPDPEPLAPVGMRTLGPGIEEVLRGIAEAVPGERYAEWLVAVARWYRPDARFGEAFCRLMAHLLGPHCPLLLDSMHPALKAAQKPWLRRLVERRREVEEALAHRDGEVKARGYSLQVSPQRGLSPLFLLRRGERRRIEWRGEDAFSLRGREEGPESVGVLLDTIEENPGVVSPGVLARPAVQDAVLGTTLQVLGPGELSYMAQASATHAVLEVAPPWVALRPQTLVLEAKQVERLEELELPLATLLGERGGVDRWLAEREGGDLTGPVRQRLEEALAELRGPALAADPGLERPFEKTREQILRALDLFGEKAVSAAARKNEVVNRRVQQLREACLPLDKQQERIVSSAHFPGKYGREFVNSYWDQMELDAAHLQVIVP
ncbi:MAG TPA: bacillithiol biosynthesis cysteine-adding enzyme BshC [Thermoanaerobaculia bacterium]|nr:bacillithiol biosynthesis cysteine-adding enzyme BshC [Thermoanaerobaculia bacterium]